MDPTASKKRKENETSVFGMVGGIAVGAAVLYGAYKLYKNWFSNTEKESGEDEMLVTGRQNRSINSRTETDPDVIPKRVRQKSMPLLDNLQWYYDNFVRVSPNDIIAANQVVKDVCCLLSTFFKKECSKVRIGQLSVTGSASQGLHISQPDDFEIAIPLLLEVNMWNLVDASTTLHHASGFWLVKRINTEFFAPQSSVWDDYLMGDYLSPLKVKQLFQDSIQKGIISWNTKYQILMSMSLSNSSVNISVVYGDNKHLTIKLLPVVMSDDGLIVSKVHPNTRVNPSFQNLWQESYTDRENKIMEKWETEHDNCKLQCLKICKAVHQRNPALQTIEFNVFLTLLLNANDSNWKVQNLEERFCDIFLHLDAAMDDGYLQSHLNPNRNLLESLSPFERQNIKYYLQEAIDTGYTMLLN